MTRCRALADGIQGLMTGMVANGVSGATLIRGSKATPWWDGPIYVDGCRSTLQEKFQKGLHVMEARWNEHDPITSADVSIDAKNERYDVTIQR